jgi:eukaryotic-like serine/threonine-protein kinase
VSAASQRPALVAGLRLVRMVGRGGEGEVWEARDHGGRRRACKLIRPEALAAPSAVDERGEYLRRIDHPALVGVFHTDILDEPGLEGWGFVEMEFVDGVSLASAPGEWELLDRLMPLAEALDLLHEGHWSQGLPLVHRDVKPANIVETPDGRLVLVDPSTLRGVDSTVVTRIGTPVFAAPEVVTGRLGPAADIYSLAVTAVALVTGARGGELADLLAEPEWLDLPAGILAGLALDPQDRPASCVAMLTEDEPLLLRDTGLLDEWRDPWVVEPATVAPRPRRWPWVAALAAATGGPTVGWATAALAGRELAVAVAGGFALHLASHLAARRPLAAGIAIPPVAWAFLLADRVAPAWPPLLRRRSRAWARATLTGTLSLVTAALVGAASATLAAGEVVALLGVGLALTTAAAAAPTVEPGAGTLLRLLLAPAWAVGAVILVVGCVVALPVAALGGRAAETARLAGTTLASAVEFARPSQA